MSDEHRVRMAAASYLRTLIDTEDFYDNAFTGNRTGEDERFAIGLVNRLADDIADEQYDPSTIQTIDNTARRSSLTPNERLVYAAAFANGVHQSLVGQYDFALVIHCAWLAVMYLREDKDLIVSDDPNIYRMVGAKPSDVVNNYALDMFHSFQDRGL